jgi:hypothetical protein
MVRDWSVPTENAIGANAFEISNIQEVETEVVVTRQPECNNVTSRRKPLNRFFADHSGPK